MNWSDVAIHAGISLLASLALLWMGLSVWLVMALSLGFWLGREIAQKKSRPWEAFTRPQPLAEWLAPVAATAMAVVWRLTQ